jgi:uncharacterized protein YcnI
MRRLLRAGTVAATTAGLLLIAVPAFAHVTVRVDDPAPGAYAEYTVRVPNESEDASTTAVEVQLPDGMVPLVEPRPGWTITADGGVLRLEGGAIPPGRYEDFQFVAQNPEAGGELSFPALQTYDDGEVVEWIGEPDADEPAPVVAIADEGGQDGEQVTAAPAAAPAGPAAGTGGGAAVDRGPDVLSLAALLVALAGLAVATLALLRSRRAAG